MSIHRSVQVPMGLGPLRSVRNRMGMGPLRSVRNRMGVRPLRSARNRMGVKQLRSAWNRMGVGPLRSVRGCIGLGLLRSVRNRMDVGLLHSVRNRMGVGPAVFFSVFSAFLLILHGFFDPFSLYGTRLHHCGGKRFAVQAFPSIRKHPDTVRRQRSLYFLEKYTSRPSAIPAATWLR